MNLEKIKESKETPENINIVVKRKRGRPRKYPLEDTKNKVKKTRGRPKGTKNKTTKVKPVKNKTRGRPKNINKLNKIYSLNKNTNNVETSNVIIHLPIKIEDIKKQNENFFNYDPTMIIPEASNEESYINYVNITSKTNDDCITEHSTSKDMAMDTKVYKNTLSNTVPNDTNSNTASNDTDNNTASNDTDSNTMLNDTDTTTGHNTSIYPDTNHNGNNKIECHIENKHESNVDNYYKNYNYNIIHKHKWYKQTPYNSKSYIKKLKEYKLLRDKRINHSNKNYSEALLKEFNNINKWPESTSIHCWWCAHSFSSVPCSIPEKIIDNDFIVYGNYCSPECAAAYLFNNNKRGNISEKLSLLHLLYKDIYQDKSIEQAYPREVLQKFGGPLSIEEFRNNHVMDKTYKIVMPELKIIIPKLELMENIKSYSSNKYTINNYNDSNRYNNNNVEHSSTDNSHTDDTKLVLKRSTPFRKYTNTLEKCMNLKIKH